MNGPLPATARQNSSASGALNVPSSFRRHVRLPDAERPAAQVDGGRHQRLVHRQRGVAVAADAGLVAQRLRQRLAEADADVLDGVVGVDVQVALRLDVQVDQAVPGQQVSMWSKKPTPVASSAWPVPSRFDGQVDLRLAGLAADLGGAVAWTIPADCGGSDRRLRGSVANQSSGSSSQQPVDLRVACRR